MKNYCIFPTIKILVRIVALLYILKVSLNVCLNRRQLDFKACVPPKTPWDPHGYSTTL